MTDIVCCGGGHGGSCRALVYEPAAHHPEHAHEIRVQRQMIADLIVGMADAPPKPGEFGPLWPCGIDGSTGKANTLRDVFDHYARALLVIAEVEARG